LKKRLKKQIGRKVDLMESKFKFQSIKKLFLFSLKVKNWRGKKGTERELGFDALTGNSIGSLIGNPTDNPTGDQYSIFQPIF